MPYSRAGSAPTSAIAETRIALTSASLVSGPRYLPRRASHHLTANSFALTTDSRRRTGRSDAVVSRSSTHVSERLAPSEPESCCLRRMCPSSKYSISSIWMCLVSTTWRSCSRSNSNLRQTKWMALDGERLAAVNFSQDRDVLGENRLGCWCFHSGRSGSRHCCSCFPGLGIPDCTSRLPGFAYHSCGEPGQAFGASNPLSSVVSASQRLNRPPRRHLQRADGIRVCLGRRRTTARCRS
jgi:hypothetical protein